MMEPSPSRWDFCTPRLKLMQGQHRALQELGTSSASSPSQHLQKVRGVHDEQKGLQAGGSMFLAGFQVFSCFSLIFLVPPQFISSSMAGRCSISLTAAGQTRSPKIIAACTQSLVASQFLCCKTSFYCTWPSGRVCSSMAMRTIFKRRSFWHFLAWFFTHFRKKKKRKERKEKKNILTHSYT